MEENKFVWWKYFNVKTLSPPAAALLWAYLIGTGSLVGDKMVFGVGIGLLLFSGVLSAQSVLKLIAEIIAKKLGVKNGNEEES